MALIEEQKSIKW